MGPMTPRTAYSAKSIGTVALLASPETPASDSPSITTTTNDIMVHQNARLPPPQPVQPPFAPLGPPTTAPFSMAFSAHASRASNNGVDNQSSRASPDTRIHVMDPMTPRSFRDVMSEDSDPQVTIQNRLSLTAAALAQPAPVLSDQIEGFQDEPETHDELSAGAGCFGPEGYKSESSTYWSEEDEPEKVEDKQEFFVSWNAETHDELGAEAGCFGLEGDQSDSLTYGSEMRVSEEDESEKVEAKKGFFSLWSPSPH
ncbi:hypothetical protein E4U13_004603 [Claviceps humidiphila]|uniref:Uncharacterized protein n=1 Tax=Claviceps humidiphila TaxID=1294629 RepID=A0A9P7PYX6_9HYPO|nr:hypothetical protein E4U13_004603 [Claviceps humidiphila]